MSEPRDASKNASGIATALIIAVVVIAVLGVLICSGAVVYMFYGIGPFVMLE